jgi:hypothetical protein
MRSARRKRNLASATGLAILACALLSIPAAASATPPGLESFGSLATIRPGKPLPDGGATTADLEAARNEFRSTQVAVTAGGSALPGVEVRAGTLTSGFGTAIPAENVTVYRESYYSVSSRSDGEGGSGSWPDALIPERDRFYGEDRDAFPVDLPAGGRVVAWIDVLVPENAVPGVYRGSISVTSAGRAIGSIPVKLKVLDFTLPSTSTLTSSFPLSSYMPCKAHTGDHSCGSDEESWQLAKLYAEAALDNRVTIPNPFPGVYGDSGAPEAPVDGRARELFERYALPLIQGTDPDVALSGARLTSVLAYGACARSGSSCLEGWRSLAGEFGFADRFSLYVCDEPYAIPAEWAQTCKPNAIRAEAAWPGVDKLITTDIRDLDGAGARGTVDTIAPVINQMADRSGDNSGNQRASYAGFLAEGGGAGNDIWMYTSCLSYGCEGANDSSYYDGWAGYAIDQPASEAEAMGWLSFAYGVSGELYYNSGRDLPNAWSKQYYAGGNGDGSLFYAGSPTGVGGVAIGGSHDIPIESMRLKRIRDGRQAYEYLKLASASQPDSSVRSVVTGVFGNLDEATHNTDVSEAAVDHARAELTAMILGRPRARLLRLRVPRSSSTLTRRGISALVTCTSRCRVRVTPVVSGPSKGRLGVRSGKLGQARVKVGANRRVWVRIRLKGSVGRRIRAVGIATHRIKARIKVRPLRS